MMEYRLDHCPICDSEPQMGYCKMDDKIVAYNVYCPKCNWTGRSFKMRYKAVEKWNNLCKMSRGIVNAI